MTADAATVLASWPADDLADALWRLSGERLSRPIARALVRRREQGRPVRSARELASLVAGIYQRRGLRRQRIHPVTRTPIVATALVGVLVAVLAAGFPLSRLAEATSLIALAVFALVNLSLVRLHQRSGSRLIPTWVPIGGAVVSLGVLGTRIVSLLT